MPSQNVHHMNSIAEESQGIKKSHTRAHAHSAQLPSASLQASFRSSLLYRALRGRRRREAHEMIPDMTDHRAALVEPSDINTFLPGCGQVRQGDLQWFPLAVAPAVSAPLTEVTDSSPQSELTRRNAATWKTGNSGFSAPYFLTFIFLNGKSV